MTVSRASRCPEAHKTSARIYTLGLRYRPTPSGGVEEFGHRPDPRVLTYWVNVVRPPALVTLTKSEFRSASPDGLTVSTKG